MSSFATALAMLAVAASALMQMVTDPRITWRFVSRSLAALAVYAVHVAIGLLVIVFLLPRGPDAAAGVVVACLGWIGLGFLGLVRFVPHLRDLPKLLMYFGLADTICLVAIAGGLLHALGAIG